MKTLTLSRNVKACGLGCYCTTLKQPDGKTVAVRTIRRKR